MLGSSIRPLEGMVYVVDDDAQVRRLLLEVLTSVGLDVELCDSGESFLRCFRPADACCVLLDVRMPRITGPDVQQWLGENHAFVPVIFLTGYADVPTAVRAMRQGAFDFLEKPFNVQNLIDRVRDALTQSRVARRLPQGVGEEPDWVGELTPRENDVLEGILAGKRNKTIAADLGIAERTVETHRSHLMAKAGVGTVGALVALVMSFRGGSGN